MKKLLIVVDMQKDFVDGALGFDGAEKVIPGIRKRIDEYLSNGDIVVYTLDTHHGDYMETQEGSNLPVPHCIEGSEGYELVPELSDVLLGCRAFKKPTFGSLDLGNYIDSIKEDLESIELCGLVSNICVLSNAVVAKAAAPEAVIIVDTALTAAFDPKLGEDLWGILQGIQIRVIKH
ncbi:MAG: cysteine hydrolase [Clostridiales bacterium]|nr:cysteine hydrolase [Clostridiales bacterium]